MDATVVFRNQLIFPWNRNNDNYFIEEMWGAVAAAAVVVVVVFLPLASHHSFPQDKLQKKFFFVTKK